MKIMGSMCAIFLCNSMMAHAVSLDAGAETQANNFQNQYGTTYYAPPYYGASLTHNQQKIIAEQQRAFELHREKYLASQQRINAIFHRQGNNQGNFLTPDKIRSRYLMLREATQARHEALLGKIESHHKAVKRKIFDQAK